MAYAPAVYLNRMRIAIVDSQLIFREFLRHICTREFGYDIAVETGSVADAAKLIRQAAPDLLLLDLLLIDGDGFRLLDLISDMRSRMRVLILSSYCDNYTVFRVETAHVDGFVDKGTTAIAGLRAALLAIRDQKRHFSESFRTVRVRRIADPNSFSKVLSPREQRFVSLAGKGMDDDVLAESLGISRRTVQTYRHTIIRKLGVKSAVGLAQYSVAMGFSRYDLRDN